VLEHTHLQVVLIEVGQHAQVDVGIPEHTSKLLSTDSLQPAAHMWSETC
jgi:hypothetical protein